MQSFQERFKLKSTIVNKNGELEVNPERAVIKPLAVQVHSPVIKSSAKSIIEHSNLSYVENSPMKVPGSASLNRKQPSPKRQFSQAPPCSFTSPLDDFPQPKYRIVDFKPYTMQDYNSIKPTKYYELGGLGSPTIGTDEWTRRKNISDKRKEYGKLAIKGLRDAGITDNAIEIVEKIKSHSVIHSRHSSALT